jgi:hypothetical protein
MEARLMSVDPELSHMGLWAAALKPPLGRLGYHPALPSSNGKERHEQSRRSARFAQILGRAAKAPVEETRAMLRDSGEMTPGSGWITSIIALSLGFLCLLACWRSTSRST